jgi:colanic acid biosynthesis glycosyl transferase WcaI
MAGTIVPQRARSGWGLDDKAWNELPSWRGTQGSQGIEAPAPTRSTPQRVIFLNRFFFPDHSATSQILTDLAFHFAGWGIDVRVVASQQRYDDPNAWLPAAESIDGVMIRRVSTTRFGRSALIGRGFDYLSFCSSAYRSIVAWAQPGDVLIAKTDPPLVSVAAMQAAKRRGLHLVNWLQDLYPEVAVALGVPLIKGRLGRGLLELRDASLRAADINVAVGERMAQIARARGIAPERVRVIPNWCDDEEIQPIAHLDNPLRREWGLADHFVVGYSGNLGRGHEFETVLAAADRLRSDPRLCFLFIGGGKKFAELAHAAHERGLDHLFRFLPYQERSALRLSLGVPDVHLISLRPELEGLVVPSKLYGIAAAGRPIIAVTASNGELAQLVRRHECGIVVEPGDGKRLADTLRSLRADPDRLAEMGRRARAMLDAHFTRRQAFARWQSLVEEIARGQCPARQEPSPPFRGEREGPVARGSARSAARGQAPRGEGEVGAVDRRVGPPPPGTARRAGRPRATLSPWPAGGEGETLSTGERRRGRALPRRDIFIWAGAILFLNQLFGVVKEMPAASLETLVSDLLAVGIFQYLAWYVVLRLLGSSGIVPAARLRDFLVTAPLCLLVFLPTSRAIWVAASGIAIYLFLTDTGDRRLRAAGIVLAALSVQELWGKVFFNLFASYLLRAEAAAVGTMLEAARPGTVWQDNAIMGPDGHGVVILGGCSSFHNVSLALLCWVTISRLRSQNWQVRDFVIGSAIGITMILLNMARIVLMAWNVELYHYWHNGIGTEIFGIGASLTILLMSLYGSRLAGRPK